VLQAAKGAGRKCEHFEYDARAKLQLHGDLEDIEAEKYEEEGDGHHGHGKDGKGITNCLMIKAG
jgi:hypothetical protein